jgi:hypothetical protein
MKVERKCPAAALLPDGKVLFAGGDRFEVFDRSLPSTAEFYDPSTNTFTLGPTMNFPRFCATATLMRNGKVLIAGGIPFPSPFSKARGDTEIYDPATNSFAIGPSINPALFQGRSLMRYEAFVGKVLLAGAPCGGAGCGFTPVYNPTTNRITPGPVVDFPPMGSIVTLPNGRVLFSESLKEMVKREEVPWAKPDFPFDSRNITKIYDPNVNETIAGPFIPFDTDVLCALPNGKILMTGGERSTLYDFQSDTFSAAPAMHGRYDDLEVFELRNGKVLFIGWDEINMFLRPSPPATELYDPATNTFARGPVDRPTETYRWPNEAFIDTTTMLADGRVLLTHPNGESVIYTP